MKINTYIKVLRVGDGAVLMSKGKGDIEVMTKKGKRIIKVVFLVPKLGMVLQACGWHRKLGHLGYSDISMMQSKEMVTGLPKLKVDRERCESCILSKHCRDPFPKQSESRAKEKLELFHSDVCGPMQNSPLSGSRYLLTFIDDATRMVWVYFLKAKSGGFATFKKIKYLVENQSGCKIKRIRSDRGTEYLSGEFTRFLEENGIERQWATTYTPQQNGV
ncbi:unnamed protein product [Arabidopsis halleri]